MSTSSQIDFKISDIKTNEISIQVESSDFFQTSPANINLLNSFSPKRLKFQSDIPKSPKQALSSKFTKAFQTYQSAKTIQTLKKIPKKSPKKPTSTVNTYTKTSEKNDSLNLEFKSKILSLNTQNKASLNIKKKSEVIYTPVKLEKHGSAYQIPKIVDPISAFSSKNLTIKSSSHHPKPKKFRNYQLCLLEDLINEKNRLKLKKIINFKDLKKRYYFRHAPKTSLMLIN